ncbi:DNA mismatch repair endonuclease MutH [Pseudoalteromonas sp. MIP2626]|uniref:DNA mismatch repair endonuclease MutH n=1 Tax=Pseudoalteromonas sp. MIP2626 TaxID=2705464 RepID=UPI0015CB978C|nr:DNA mismatch repair endonuclease MutH [Pseudoalteromonas sp. MIP2626]
MKAPKPPKSLEELISRANDIAGLSIVELAGRYSLNVPKDLTKNKGWVGQMLEYVLGATASSKPVPDFELLGVELKTIPISKLGKPLETTFITSTPLLNISGAKWEDSVVKKKLRNVLWVPILSCKSIPFPNRIIGTGFLWELDKELEKTLKNDWEEQMELIALGMVEKITANLGTALQIRPKAASSSSVTNAIGKHGKVIQTNPKGYYLKKEITQKILDDQFRL